MALLIGACDGDDIPCPEVNQPPIQELNKWEKQRFPYGDFDTLVFVIEEPKIGRQDTVKLGRILYDSSVVNHGDSVNVETACKKAYERRTQEYVAIYGTDYKDRLTFKNESDFDGLIVRWDEHSNGPPHFSLSQHYGEQNQISLSDTDTAIVKGIQYQDVYKSFKNNSYNYIYNIKYGFVFIHDTKISKKWSLLEAY